VLESLERAGLVTITVADGQVRLAHPLHAKVVRAAMPKLRARAVLLAQAERLAAAGAAPGPSELRIAVWRPGAGAQPDPAAPRRPPGARRARLPYGAAAGGGGAQRATGRGRCVAARRGAV